MKKGRVKAKRNIGEGLNSLRKNSYEIDMHPRKLQKGHL